MSEASSTTLDPAVIAGVIAGVAVVGFIIFPLLVCYALRKFRAARAEVAPGVDVASTTSSPSGAERRSSNMSRRSLSPNPIQPSPRPTPEWATGEAASARDAASKTAIRAEAAGQAAAEQEAMMAKVLELAKLVPLLPTLREEEEKQRTKGLVAAGHAAPKPAPRPAAAAAAPAGGAWTGRDRDSPPGGGGEVDLILAARGGLRGGLAADYLDARLAPLPVAPSGGAAAGSGSAGGASRALPPLQPPGALPPAPLPPLIDPAADASQHPTLLRTLLYPPAHAPSYGKPPLAAAATPATSAAPTRCASHRGGAPRAASPLHAAPPGAALSADDAGGGGYGGGPPRAAAAEAEWWRRNPVPGAPGVRQSPRSGRASPSILPPARSPGARSPEPPAAARPSPGRTSPVRPGLDGGRFAVVHGLRAGYAAAEAERRSDEDLGARTAAAQAHIEKALRALDNAPAAVDDPFGYVASCLDATRAGRPPPPPPPPADGTLRGGLDGRSRAILVGALEQGLFEALKLRADDPTAFLVAYLRARALPVPEELGHPPPPPPQ